MGSKVNESGPCGMTMWQRYKTSLSQTIDGLQRHTVSEGPTVDDTNGEVTNEVSMRQYAFQPLDTPDSLLPFIPADTIRATQLDPDRLWIVVNDVVFDCTEFVSQHPGGATVIQSFSGENCTWQFWRFHSQGVMRRFGRPLRIGRTEGVANRFKERPPIVGLRKLGVDDEW